MERPAWIRGQVPRGFWKNSDNRRQYMQWLGEQLGFQKPEDWYRITQKDFCKNKGRTLLRYCGESALVAVMEYFPDYDWKEWFFDRVPLNFWSKQKNRYRYMDWLGKQLGFQEPEDWYRVSQKDFETNKGSGLLAKYYQGSPSLAVKEYFPDYEWKEWLFVNTPHDFWAKSENRHRYMDWLGKQLGFQKPEDWYNVNQESFESNKGGGLLVGYYKCSPSAAVMDFFPQHEWKEWLFVNAPNNFWNKKENRHQYMQWLGKQLGFQKPEDWYRVTLKDFELNKGSGLLANYYQSSPSAAVMEYLPEYEWKEWLFSKAPQKLWENPRNRNRYMDWLGTKLGFQGPEDWYEITAKDFRENEGHSFLSYYHNSPLAAVMDYLPHYEWKEWLFVNGSNDFWNKIENRRRYMNWLGKQLGFQEPEDWYRVTGKDFRKNKGYGFLKYYQGSPSAAIRDCFPNYDWKEWLFSMGPLRFWKDSDNRRRYMQRLGMQLGYKDPEDWYQVTAKDFYKHNGGGILKYYQYSPSVAVMDYLPEYAWKEWLFNQVPLNFWNKSENRYQYMEWLAKELGFQKPEDWYRITLKDFHKNNGCGFLQYYQDSPSKAVMNYLPEYAWKEWLFNQTPLNFWNKPENRRRYMEWLGKKLGFQEPEDWYTITQKDFEVNNGSGLLTCYYQASPSAAVMDYFPEYDWKEWLFNKAPQNLWETPKNRHRYMQWLGKRLGYSTLEDWYRISQKDFCKNMGNGFLTYYKASPSAAVMDYFPEYDWKEWLFSNVPLNFWKNLDNRRRYLKWLGDRLGYSTLEDWYRVTEKDFRRNKGNGFLRYYQGSPSASVMACFPGYDWQPEKFSFHKKRQQHLYRIIKKVFIGYDVKWDFKHPAMRFKSSDRRMELDIFIPLLNLAFEYQGEQHVLPISEWGGISVLEEVQRRDKEKRNACKKQGIVLVEVPHTWDGHEDSAIEMLSIQFVKKVKDKVKGTEQIHSALKAINTYCKKKQRKQHENQLANQQADFSFIAQ